MIPVLLMIVGPAWAEAEVRLLMHDRAVHGQAVSVLIEVSNTGSEPLSYPDLTNRPWLVQFNTVAPDGTKRTLYSTPPDVDSERTWSIPAEGRRRALFEVPTSDTWPTGKASLSLTVAGTALKKRRVQIVQLSAHHEDAYAEPVDQTQGTPVALLSVPVSGDTELWLRQGDRKEFLRTVPGTIKAELSVARIEQGIGRWITWTDSSGQLWAMRTQDAPFPVRLPWPNIEKCGRAASDGSDRLVLPICVQSPRGEFGQLIAAIIDGPTSPSTRSVTRFRPSIHLTNVNAGGHVDWILVRPSALDQVQLPHTDEHTRPPAVMPKWRAKEGERILSASLEMTRGPTVRTVLEDGRTMVYSLGADPN